MEQNFSSIQDEVTEKKKKLKAQNLNQKPKQNLRLQNLSSYPQIFPKSLGRVQEAPSKIETTLMPWNLKSQRNLK